MTRDDLYQTLGRLGLYSWRQKAGALGLNNEKMMEADRDKAPVPDWLANKVDAMFAETESQKLPERFLVARGIDTDYVIHVHRPAFIVGIYQDDSVKLITWFNVPPSRKAEREVLIDLAVAAYNTAVAAEDLEHELAADDAHQEWLNEDER